jgi:hypothetical protein
MSNSGYWPPLLPIQRTSRDAWQTGAYITIVVNKPTTQNAITTTVTQPSIFSGRERVKSPITRLLLASSIINAMIGATITPLMTALQYRARIGSTGRKLMAVPTNTNRR